MAVVRLRPEPEYFNFGKSFFLLYIQKKPFLLLGAMHHFKILANLLLGVKLRAQKEIKKEKQAVAELCQAQVKLDVLKLNYISFLLN